MGCHRKLSGCSPQLVADPDSRPAEAELDNLLDTEAAACTQAVDLQEQRTLDRQAQRTLDMVHLALVLGTWLVHHSLLQRLYTNGVNCHSRSLL